MEKKTTSKKIDKWGAVENIIKILGVELDKYSKEGAKKRWAVKRQLDAFERYMAEIKLLRLEEDSIKVQQGDSRYTYYSKTAVKKALNERLN